MDIAISRWFSSAILDLDTTTAPSEETEKTQGVEDWKFSSHLCD
jgi:hypothetical protein